MSLESSTYIDGLDVLNPTSSDPVSQGDDHIKLLKSTIKTTFPNVTGAVTTTHTELNFLNDATNLATNNALVKRSSIGAASFSTVSATTLTGAVSTALQPNITGVGALDSGSISSGFGVINNGNSAIQTTGTVSGSTVSGSTVTCTNLGHSSDSDLVAFTNGAMSVTGNLVVNNIDFSILNTALTSGDKTDTRIANILDNVYPVGSVYMSLTQSASPASLFGGVWSAIGAGRVLMGHGEGTDINGVTHTAAVGTADTTGEYEHTLSTSQLPDHNHQWNNHGAGTDQRIDLTSDGAGGDHTYNTDGDALNYSGGELFHDAWTSKKQSVSGGENASAHNNTQPHLAVYMWKRDS